MSSHSTNLEPKSWLTMNLDLGWECQSLPSEAKKKRRKIPQSKSGRKQKKRKEGKFPIKEKVKKKRKKIPNQRVGESKRKERKLLIKDRKKSEEMCRKVFGPDNICTIQNCHQMNKKGKGNHDLKVVFSLWLPTKIPCASDFFFFSPRTKQKQKKEKSQKNQKPKTHKSRKKKPPKEPIPKGSPIDPWSRM